MSITNGLHFECTLTPTDETWRPAHLWIPRFSYRVPRALAGPPPRRKFLDTHLAIQVIAQIMVPADLTGGILYPTDAAAGRTGKMFNFRT